MTKNSSETIESLGITQRNGKPAFIILCPNVIPPSAISIYVAYQISNGSYAIDKVYSTNDTSIVLPVIDNNGVLKNNYDTGITTYIMYGVYD